MLGNGRLARLLVYPSHDWRCCQGYIEDKPFRARCAILSGWLNVYVDGVIVKRPNDDELFGRQYRERGGAAGTKKWLLSQES